MKTILRIMLVLMVLIGSIIVMGYIGTSDRFETKPEWTNIIIGFIMVIIGAFGLYKTSK